MTFGDFKDFTKRTASDKILPDKAFKIYMVDIKGVLLQWFIYIFFDKKLLGVLLKMKICQTKNELKNLTNQLLENLEREKYPHLLKIKFRVLILSICN